MELPKKRIKETDLARITLSLTTKGDLLVDLQCQTPTEVQEHLDTLSKDDSGYENAHTVAGAMRLFSEHYLQINAELVRYIRNI